MSSINAALAVPHVAAVTLAELREGWTWAS
jgi:hypothetical protein